MRPDLSHEPSYCPHLILLANPNHDIEPELLALTQARSQREQKLYKHYICGWISSELNPQRLAEKIVDLGNSLGTIPSLNNSSFFPFYEHIRLQLLQESSSINTVLPGQFNFVNSYVYHNYYGQLTDIMTNNAVLTDMFPEISRNLLQQAFQYQQEPKATYGLVKIWQDNIEQGNSTTLPNNAIFLAAEKLLHAKNIGFVSLEDKLIYSLYSLIYQVDLISVESIAPSIVAAISEPGTLKSYLASIDDKRWQQITANNQSQ